MASTLYTPPDNSCVLVYRTSNLDRAPSMFGSIRRKFSKSQQSSNTSTRTPSFRLSKRSDSSMNTPFSKSPSTRRPDRPGMNAFTTPSNEPPPAYTPSPNAAPMPNTVVPAPGGSSSTATSNPAQPLPADDPYAFLSTFDTKFLIDDSGSMAGRSWRETQKALETITPICTAHDADGIDIHFLNHADQPIYQNVKIPSTVTEIFTTVRPGGGTPTGQRLRNILRPYLERVKRNPDGVKPLNIIVITDGEASDDVESVLIEAAKKLDRYDAPAWQIGIQFFQVGNEPGARQALKQLDDDLAEISGDEDLRDIVDTVPMTDGENKELTGNGILKVVLGAVTRRLDRNSKELHRKIQ